MLADPATDLGSVTTAAAVEPAVFIAATRRVVLGLGVPQQHQTAHGASRFGSVSRINVQTDAQDKVTSARSILKKMT